MPVSTINDAQIKQKIRKMTEIRNKMKELLSDAKDILNGAPHIVQIRAESYWLAHIAMAIDDDHSFCGSSMCTMQDTIKELKEEMEYEEEDQ